MKCFYNILYIKQLKEMMKPVSLPISLLFKINGVDTIENFTQYDKENAMLTGFNIYTGIITPTTPLETLTTIVPNKTTNDFIISNIIWNTHFHLNTDISWIQLEVNRRLKSMSSYMHMYSSPMFLCEIGDVQVFIYNNNINEGIKYKPPPYFKSSTISYNNAVSNWKHTNDLLDYVLTSVNNIKECFIKLSFLNKHSFISNDWKSLSQLIRDDDFLVVINDYEFKCNPCLYITNQSATIILPPTVFAIPTDRLSDLESYMTKLLGFVPDIMHKAIIMSDTKFNSKYQDYSKVVVIFKPYNGNPKHTMTTKMINAFYTLSESSKGEDGWIQIDDCWIYEY